MILQIADILDRSALAAVREALSGEAIWEDGGATAKGRARAAKNNLQARPSAPAAKGAMEMISAAILANETLRAAALPDRIARLMINRYDEGMEYGAHVDAPYIDGVRTDLSFTLFLGDPSDYDGGALVIDSAGAEDEIKLPAGSLVLYPSTFLHRVERVARGSRLAAVGWIRSRVRSTERRAMLFDLERSLAELAAAGAPASVRDRLANLRNNLIRDFGD
ncbi:MAG: Fe2+-dependent dioxygenase [Pseudomonadota bacterium]|nr:Fe2+-dependent dioxygenase [Pseudomonadota bacterium]